MNNFHDRFLLLYDKGKILLFFKDISIKYLSEYYMELEHTDIIKADIDKVYKLVRDDLSEIAKHLPNIKKIERIQYNSRKKQSTEIINQWHADVELPKLVKKFISDDILSWKDTAKWNNDKKTVQYKLESFLNDDLFEAYGKNYFISKGNSETILKITCTVNIYPEKIPGIPRIFSNKVKPLLERIISTMLKPNLTSLGIGLKNYIHENPETLH